MTNYLLARPDEAAMIGAHVKHGRMVPIAEGGELFSLSRWDRIPPIVPATHLPIADYVVGLELLGFTFWIVEEACGHRQVIRGEPVDDVPESWDRRALDIMRAIGKGRKAEVLPFLLARGDTVHGSLQLDPRSGGILAGVQDVSAEGMAVMTIPDQINTDGITIDAAIDLHRSATCSANLAGDEQGAAENAVRSSPLDPTFIATFKAKDQAFNDACERQSDALDILLAAPIVTLEEMHRKAIYLRLAGEYGSHGDRTMDLLLKSMLAPSAREKM